MKKHAESIATGGLRSRDVAQLLNLERWPLYGRIGETMSHEFDAGGPLDAPSVLPAGSVNSTEWRNGRGDMLARQTEIRRP
jgi:hypothetical protein